MQLMDFKTPTLQRNSSLLNLALTRYLLLPILLLILLMHCNLLSEWNKINISGSAGGFYTRESAHHMGASINAINIQEEYLHGFGGSFLENFEGHSPFRRHGSRRNITGQTIPCIAKFLRTI